MNNTIYLTGEITEELIFPIVQKLQEIEEDNFNKHFYCIYDQKFLESKEIAPIKIYINSTGGELESTLALISQMKSMKTPIHTYVLGYAYSGGLVIFMAGDKRYVSPLAMLMFHNPFFEEVSGSSIQIQKFSEYSIKLSCMFFKLCMPNSMPDTIVEKFKKPFEQNYDFYFTGEEAVEWNLATELIDIHIKN